MHGKLKIIQQHNNKNKRVMKIILTIIAVAFYLQPQAQASMPDSLLNKNLIDARQYLTGIGKPKDEARALSIYKECANAGSAKAMNALGIIYKEGVGTKADRQKGIDWFTKAGNNNYSQGWYNLGLIYKNAVVAEERNFEKAFNYFSKGVALDDDDCDYMQAYMLYKGLGCKQNYEQAAVLFEKGANLNRSGSMYFFGLCLRNGYGIALDIDKAKYWLDKAAKKNYRMATLELMTKSGENSNEKAKELATQLKAISITSTAALNTYQKLEQNISANTIEGVYEGHMIRYDWSGQHAINTSKLLLDVKYEGGKLIGNWVESDSTIVPLEATLTSKNMLFKNMQYSKTDHYSMFKAMGYSFENAKLQWNRKDGEVYLSGNIQMFSTQRNEPEKPLFIWLKRVSAKSGSANRITITNEDGSPMVLKNDLVAYPNPFDNAITVEFELKEACMVQTELFTIDGKLIYKNPAGLLEEGNYKIQVQPQQLVAGTYILVLKYGNKTQTTKVVKL
jgi:uncharacterized protein